MSISSLDKMEAAVTPAISVLFNGKEVIQIAKTLTSLEIQECGDFSLINLKGQSIGEDNDDSFVKMSKFAEIQHNVLKASMVSPTYEEVESMLLKYAGVDNFKERMRELVEKFNLIDDSKLRAEMELEYAKLELRSKFFFPQDFLIDMFTFATQQDVSDIKKLVSEEILLNAAIIAEGKCLISDILCKDGYFTEFNKMDIEKRGKILLLESRNKK